MAPCSVYIVLNVPFNIQSRLLECCKIFNFNINYSGSVQWEIILDGRIECSAAITGDFSQVLLFLYLLFSFAVDIYKLLIS